MRRTNIAVLSISCFIAVVSSLSLNCSHAVADNKISEGLNNSTQALRPLSAYCKKVSEQLGKTQALPKGATYSIKLVIARDGAFSIETISGDAIAVEKLPEIKAILKSESFEPPPAGYPSPLALNASFSPTSSQPSVTAQEVDFGPYMKELQHKIKAHWWPPRFDKTVQTIAIFKVWSDGHMSDLKITTDPKSSDAESAATTALSLASPFQPLPDGAPNDVDIQFTFDYNILSGRRPMSLKAPVQGANSALIADFIKVGGPILSQEKYAELEKICEKARVTAEKSGPNDPALANINSVLAVACQMQEKFADAEKAYKRAIDIRLKTLDQFNPQIPEAMNELVGCYLTQRKFLEAEKLAKQALALAENANGKDCAGSAESLLNLGRAYFEQNRFSEAKPLLLRALKIREAAVGANHVKVAPALSALALLYEREKNFSEAEPLFLRALTIHEAKFAPESFAVISDVRNLAECYRSQGKIQEAEDLMKRSPKDVLTTPSLLPWLIVK